MRSDLYGVFCNLAFATLYKRIRMWMVATVDGYGPELKPIDVLKKNVHSNNVYIWNAQRYPYKTWSQNKIDIGLRLSTADWPREDETFCRGSRLNMNYPCKLYSWRVKAMTAVAQRRCAKYIDWMGHRQYNDTVILQNNMSGYFCRKAKPQRSASQKKTSTSAIGLTPHQHLVQFTKQRLLASCEMYPGWCHFAGSDVDSA